MISGYETEEAEVSSRTPDLATNFLNQQRAFGLVVAVRRGVATKEHKGDTREEPQNGVNGPARHGPNQGMQAGERRRKESVSIASHLGAQWGEALAERNEAKSRDPVAFTRASYQQAAAGGAFLIKNRCHRGRGPSTRWRSIRMTRVFFARHCASRCRLFSTEKRKLQACALFGHDRS